MFKFESAMPYNRLKKWGDKNGMFIDSLEISNDPDYIVKELRRYRNSDDYMLEGQYGKDFSVENIAKETQVFLDILRNKKADFVPKTKVVIAKNKNGKETLFLVQRKINGENFKDNFDKESISALSESERKQILSIVNNLIETYKESYNREDEHGLSVEFIKLQNYVKDKDGKIFLVDMSPVYNYPVRNFVLDVVTFLRRFNFSQKDLFGLAKDIEQSVRSSFDKYDEILLKEFLYQKLSFKELLNE